MPARRPSAVDLLRHLERSNCRECRLPSCMAFAAAVVRGERQLRDCPRLTPEGFAALQAQFGPDLGEPTTTTTTTAAANEAYGQEIMAALQARLARVDLAAAAARLGGEVRGDRLAVRCLGRIFELDAAGRLYSQCHVNPWVHAPLLDYVLESAGAAPTGPWVLFRELGHTQDWIRFFDHRCAGELHRLADMDPQLFVDLLRIFGGKPPVDPGDGSFAPEALVIHPLPRVPILISYWEAEGDFESKLTVFFDRTAEKNLPAESLYRLTGGLVEMLRRILPRHGAGLL
jgi:hypothetical protein